MLPINKIMTVEAKKIRKKQDLYNCYPNMSKKKMSIRLNGIISENRNITEDEAKKIKIPYDHEIKLFKAEVDPIYFGVKLK